MEIKYGLISCDDHLAADKDTFTSRMSKEKWGDRIPELRPTQDPKHMAVDWGEPDTWRWFINNEPVAPRGVANCPTAMQTPQWGEAGARRKYFLSAGPMFLQWFTILSSGPRQWTETGLMQQSYL